MKTVELITDYDVGTKEVRLSVVIGDAQIGASIVKLGAKVLAKGEVENIVLGNGAKIRGKALYVKSAVTDVNDSTNHTSLTYRFRSGTVVREFECMATVEQDGDSVVYRAKFNLV